MQEVTLTLSLEETNLILDALGDKPFKTVFALIRKIQNQAASQLQEGVTPEVTGGTTRTQSPTITP